MFEYQILKHKYMRHRFNPNAIASVCNGRVRISHDRRANTTGRTPYMFCGKRVIITDNNVFRDGNWIGHLYIDDYGNKCVIGPHNKGLIEEVPSSL